MPIDPIIAEHVDLPDLNSCPYGFLMHLGLQVDGDAWRDVVVRLCQRLLPLAAEAQAQGSEFRILSVKQKFDTLLVSYRGGTDEIKAEIGRTKDEALHLSARGRVDVATTALVTTIWKPLIIPRSTDGCRRNGEGGSRPTTRST